MKDPNCPKFLESHVQKLKEAWEDTNEKAQKRKKELTGNYFWKFQRFDTWKLRLLILCKHFGTFHKRLLQITWHPGKRFTNKLRNVIRNWTWLIKNSHLSKRSSTWREIYLFMRLIKRRELHSGQILKDSLTWSMMQITVCKVSTFSTNLDFAKK